MSGLWLVEKEDKQHWIKISAGFPVLDIRANFGLPPPWHSKLTSASVGQVEPLKKRKKYFHFGPKPFQSACVCGIHFNHTNHMVLCANIHMNIKMILKFGLTSRPTVPKPAWGAALPLTLLHQVWSWHYCTSHFHSDANNRTTAGAHLEREELTKNYHFWALMKLSV